MKVQFNQQQNYNPQFKSAIDTGLRYLATNQAVGANGVEKFEIMFVPLHEKEYVFPLVSSFVALK